MHDAFLKSVFSDRRMIEVLIQSHVREWADELDFSTLREESTQLVSKRTLQRRHPDMIWSVDTFDGRKVVFLMEFQRAVDPLMALRTTTYAALTLEGIASDERIRAGDPLPEFVYLVLYHGDHPWSAPDRVVDLFKRSDPGKYRLVAWGEDKAEGESRDDLVALVLGLARNVSARDMAARMLALRMAVERYGEADLDAFLFERMYTMLELRGYTEGLTQLREKTMAELVDRFQRSLDELVQKGRRQGIQQGARRGRQEGQALVLRRIIARKFGDDTAGQLSALLDDVSASEDIDRVTDALIECGTSEEFIERVRTA